ncbi:hypothetical protein IX308_000591 [Porphyromonas levii]|nr:hypothetical protein [Porphyromonas levii]MBR8784420.1 hypothetical protein [Porphyromonas levii]
MHQSVQMMGMMMRMSMMMFADTLYPRESILIV